MGCTGGRCCFPLCHPHTWAASAGLVSSFVNCDNSINSHQKRHIPIWENNKSGTFTGACQAPRWLPGAGINTTWAVLREETHVAIRQTGLPRLRPRGLLQGISNPDPRAQPELLPGALPACSCPDPSSNCQFGLSVPCDPSIHQSSSAEGLNSFCTNVVNLGTSPQNSVFK